MGIFYVDALIAAPHAPNTHGGLKLLVDTGSLYTWISETRLHALGIEPLARRRVVTIDGSTTERPLAEVRMTLEGQTLTTQCLAGREGDIEVLGALSLESFGLGVDPIQRRLIPAIIFGAGAPCASAAGSRQESAASIARARPKSRAVRPPASWLQRRSVTSL